MWGTHLTILHEYHDARTEPGLFPANEYGRNEASNGNDEMCFWKRQKY